MYGPPGRFSFPVGAAVGWDDGGSVVGPAVGKYVGIYGASKL